MSFKQEFKKFEKTAKTFRNNQCLQIQKIALSDKKIQKKFKDMRNEKRLVFHGLFCPETISIPEERWVLFKFRCSTGIYCLLNPSFIVVVNIVDKKVERIIEPLDWNDRQFS